MAALIARGLGLVLVAFAAALGTAVVFGGASGKDIRVAAILGVCIGASSALGSEYRTTRNDRFLWAAVVVVAVGAVAVGIFG
jgi:hypothetical protein